MNARVNPFADLSTPLPSFTVKPRKQETLAEEAVTRIAEENNFPSRQAPRARELRRKRRLYTTGRNRQFNIKATPETVERFYKMADARKVALCALLEQAIDALDREGAEATRV
jgi:hypothetical protein